MAINRSKVEANAQKYVRKGAWDKALKEYLLLVEDDPKDVRSLLKCADFYVKLERNRDALAAYRSVAQHYASQDMYEKAIAVYKQALRIDEEQVELHQALGEAYHRLGRLKDAVRAFHQAQRMYKDRGDSQSQREILEYMVRIDPDDMGLRIQLAERYAKDNLREESINLFLFAADILDQEGRLDELVQVIERVLFLDPDNIVLRKRVVHIYLDRQDNKHALKHLQVCFKSVPNDIETMELLGQAFERLERVDKAIMVYEELATLYRQQGQDARLQNVYQRIARLDPGHQSARRTLSQSNTARRPSVDDSDVLAGPADTDSLRSRQSTPNTQDALDGVEFLDDDLVLVPESRASAVQPARQPTAQSVRLPVQQEFQSSGTSARLQPPRGPQPQRGAAIAASAKPMIDISEGVVFLDDPSEAILEMDDVELLDDSFAELESLEEVALLGDEGDGSEGLSETDVRQLLTECQVFLKYGLYDKANTVIGAVLDRAPNSIVAQEQMLALHEAMGNKALAVGRLLELARITRMQPARAHAYLTRAAALSLDPNQIHYEAQRLGINLDEDPMLEGLAEISLVSLDEISAQPLEVEPLSLEEDDAYDDGGVLFLYDEESEVEVAPAGAIEVGHIPVLADSSSILGDDELMFDNAEFVDLDVDEFSSMSADEMSALENVASEVYQDEAATMGLVFSSKDADDIFDDLFGDFLNSSEAVNLGSDDPIGEMAEIDFFIQQGLTEEADEALEAFATEHPQHAGLNKRRAQLETVRSGIAVDDNPFGAQSLSQKFNNPFHNTDATDTTDTTHAPLIELEPVNNSNLELGSSYRDMGLFEEAIEEFLQATDDPDAAPSARYNIALCELDLGQIDRARTTLKTLLQDQNTLTDDVRHAAQTKLQELET
ncbi:MAG: tetratricopeptide repeat protein [Bradymonadaceae bacterium]|nr:tetratricopeptide repeat protein [Lujinxingiaceae bacterium]